MANKTFVVFKREYLERVRSKWFVIATLLGPVFLAVVMVLPIGYGDGQLRRSARLDLDLGRREVNH